MVVSESKLKLQVGRWERTTGLDLDRGQRVRFPGDQLSVLDFHSSLANETIHVVSIVEAPFVMLKDSISKPTENVTKDDLEGKTKV